jgi:hypothetical protein
VLLHELAHVKRRDLAINALQILLQIVWFFHPGLWLTNWLIRREREKACDDVVLNALNGERQTYAESILKVVKSASPALPPAFGTLGIIERNSAMKIRFKRILDQKRKISSQVGLAGVIAILLIAGVILPLAKSTADTKHPDSKVPQVEAAETVQSDPSGKSSGNATDALLKTATDQAVLLKIASASESSRAGIRSGSVKIYSQTNNFGDDRSVDATFSTMFSGNKMIASSHTEKDGKIQKKKQAPDNLQWGNDEFFIYDGKNVFSSGQNADIVGVYNWSYLQGKSYHQYFHPFMLGFCIGEVPLTQWIKQNFDKIKVNREGELYVLLLEDPSKTSKIWIDPNQGFLIIKETGSSQTGSCEQSIKATQFNGIWYPYYIHQMNYSGTGRQRKRTIEQDWRTIEFSPNLAIDEHKFTIDGAIFPSTHGIRDYRVNNPAATCKLESFSRESLETTKDPTAVRPGFLTSGGPVVTARSN